MCLHMCFCVSAKARRPDITHQEISWLTCCLLEGPNMVRRRFTNAYQSCIGIRPARSSLSITRFSSSHSVRVQGQRKMSLCEAPSPEHAMKPMD